MYTHTKKLTETTLSLNMRAYMELSYKRWEKMDGVMQDVMKGAERCYPFCLRTPSSSSSSSDLERLGPYSYILYFYYQPSVEFSHEKKETGRHVQTDIQT